MKGKESKFRATIRWKRQERPAPVLYSRDHTVAFHGKTDLELSAAREYFGNEQLVNPEELYISAISSCHMMTYIYLCFANGMEVSAYKDDATGYLVEEEGQFRVRRVKLRPMITFHTEESREKRALAIRMVGEAQDECYISNSIKTRVDIEPLFVFDPDG